MKNYDFEKSISDRILENVRRLSENISEDIVEYSKKISEITIRKNPKLVQKYIDGHSALTEMVTHAKNIAEFDINDRLVGEWIVYILNEERLKNIKNRKSLIKDVIIDDE